VGEILFLVEKKKKNGNEGWGSQRKEGTHALQKAKNQGGRNQSQGWGKKKKKKLKKRRVDEGTLSNPGKEAVPEGGIKGQGYESRKNESPILPDKTVVKKQKRELETTETQKNVSPRRKPWGRAWGGLRAMRCCVGNKSRTLQARN